MSAARREIAPLVERARGGDEVARDELWRVLYGELRSLARSRRLPLHEVTALQTTALVHEAYLKMGHGLKWEFETIGAFYVAAARAMRNILVDEARSLGRLKRGGGGLRLRLDEGLGLCASETEQWLALEVALERLELHDEQLAKLVDLRFFAGLPIHRICRILGVSAATYHRHWSYAKSWLLREVAREMSA
ncbi:MAG: ECF-type sigma factor [Planctomycetota bacterium]